ncbi:MAG TPA: DNA-processing protein DprA, partial [Bacteroidia bacterium]|nr:DNA-processing protein DprA [Bacteroidia bacterium]
MSTFSQKGAKRNKSEMLLRAKFFSVKITRNHLLLSKTFLENLRQLGINAPTILSYKGNLSLLKSKKIGFCGSRKASEKGLNVAKDVTQQVSKKGITVVSGYASGIDQQTHYWALKENGNTIIVLPEGINHFKVKSFVKEVWDWNRTLIISEFMPNAIWSAGRAMERNLTIVALSDV